MAQDDIADRVRLTAPCDPTADRVEHAAHQYQVGQAFTSFNAFLDTGDIDAITIASPIGLHFEQGMKALQAGKHVHFNKTMSVTTDEADELIELAARRNLRIISSPGEMLRPHNIAIKKLIREGAIGDVTWAIAGAAFESYHEDEPERELGTGLTPIDPSWYFRKPGGGPLFDMTVYALHGLTGILGPAHAVTALSGIRIPERRFADRVIPTEADDNTLILLDFGSGLVAVVYGTAAGAVKHPLDFSGTYFGTRGKIEGLKLNGEPFDYPRREIAITAPDGGTQPGFGGNEWILPNVEGIHRTIGEQHVFADIMQLVDWMRDDKPSPATAAHARHVVEIIEASYRSSETSQRQALRTTF